MANLEAKAEWQPVRQLETYELARGGLNGNMNDQAKSLLARTEFLKNHTDKFVVHSNSSVINFFTPKELKDWINDPENYDVSDILIRYQALASGGEMQFPSGTFRVTKAIPSYKSWVGVRGDYFNRGTRVVVDSPVTLDPVISSASPIELRDIQFKDKQNRQHTLLKQPGYQIRHSGLWVQAFNIGIDEHGTYDHFEDCYFIGNNIGVKVRATAATGTDVQSTVWGFNRCFFLYNDIGIDTSPNYGIGPNEDFMNILLSTCGFELNRIGYNAPTRNWYLTFQNCWFEANSEFGLFAPNSDVIEFNTRHNANSPKSIGTSHLEFLPGRSKFSELQAAVLKGRDDANLIIDSDLELKSTYEESSNSYKAGNKLFQHFTSDGGGASAGITFYRTSAAGSSIVHGAALRFYTTESNVINDGAAIERFELTRIGHFEPLSDNRYNIGSGINRLARVYTTKIMYTSTVGDFYGTGSPEGVVTAGIGSTYRRVDGSAGTCFYVKESGTGNTGWVAK